MKMSSVEKKYSNVHCPNCGSLNHSVRRFVQNLLMAGSPEFTDAEGSIHVHDTNNIHSTNYACLVCQHRWEVNERNTCWCGWEQKFWFESKVAQ